MRGGRVAPQDFRLRQRSRRARLQAGTSGAVLQPARPLLHQRQQWRSSSQPSSAWGGEPVVMRAIRLRTQSAVTGRSVRGWTQRPGEHISRAMRGLLLRSMLGIACLGALLVAWVVGARSLSIWLDRLHTVEIAAQPIVRLGVEDAELPQPVEVSLAVFRRGLVRLIGIFAGCRIAGFHIVA